MQLINQKLRTLFIFALVLSVGFPAGILCIIFGAGNKIVPLLVTGIILTVLGFYLMPILWLKYAEKRRDRALLLVVEHDHLYTVEEIAAQTGYRPADVQSIIKKMILARELVGYIFQDGKLQCNTNQKQSKRTGRTRMCEQCGAVMQHDGEKFYCEYCRNTVEE